ncbi:hypothetical protein KY284_030249 [Solanum tuberosum]|nr:hypothetical protein KY284_030249 [Solanum tuberosum]
MDDLPPSKRITSDFGVNARSMEKSKQILEEKCIEELGSKKKNDSIALQEVINNAKASGIKIVEGGITRKAKDNDSMEAVSASLDQDKYEEHRVFA